MNATFTSSRLRTILVAAFAATALVLGGFTISAAAPDTASSGSGGGTHIAMLSR